MYLADIISQQLVVDETQLKSEPELLQEIQIRFAELGYYPKHLIDAKYGPKVVAANISFCQDYKLNSFRTGRYGLTWASTLINAKPAPQNRS